METAVAPVLAVARDRAVRLALVALLAASAFALASCAFNPASGQLEVTTMSTERESSIGRREARKVEKHIGLVDDASIAAYLSRVGQRVAAHSPRKDMTYRFHVVDMSDANAFALPGGYIYVSRGLLALTNSEAELAGVLGHEIAHVAARHAAQRETHQMGAKLLGSLAAAAGGAVGGLSGAQTMGQMGMYAGMGMMASYSRDQEREADELGQKMAAATGYDPAAFADFLDTLNRYTELRLGGQRQVGFLDSHPSTPERRRNASRRSTGVQIGEGEAFAPGRADYLALLLGLRLGEDPSYGVFIRSRFLHPDIGYAVEFPRGWEKGRELSFAAAVSPRKDALIKVLRQGPAREPALAARSYARGARISLVGGESLSIGGLPAYRARAYTEDGQYKLTQHLTWVGHPNAVLRVVGTSRRESYSSYEPIFTEVADSVRMIRAHERKLIVDTRLHAVPARSGETIAALSDRVASTWTPDQTAVANGLGTRQRLDLGYLVKIAVQRPYR